MSKQIQKTHLFGEMDLDLDLSFDEIYKKAFACAEACGYMIDQYKKNKLKLFGTDNEICVIDFKNEKVIKVMRAQYSDDKKLIVKWHKVKKGSYISIYKV